MLVKLLDKFDPKSDGADRSYSDIYEESSKLLYEEIDYGLEAANCLRFAESLQQAGLDYVRVPQVYNEVTTPRVLTLEYVPSFKLTDLPRVEAAGLDPKLLAKRTADAFLTQVLSTGGARAPPTPRPAHPARRSPPRRCPPRRSLPPAGRPRSALSLSRRLLPLRPSPGQPVRGRGRQAGLLRLRHDERASAQRLQRLQGGVRRRLRRRALHLRAAARNEREEARGRSRADGGEL